MPKLPLARIFFCCSSLMAAPVAAQEGVAPHSPAGEEVPRLSQPNSLTLVLPETIQSAREITLSGPRTTAPSLPGRATTLKAPPNSFYQTPGEVLPWIKAAPLANPDRIKLIPFGKSGQGRELLALEITPVKKPRSKWRRLAVLCRQHGDEPEATASGTLFIKQWLDSPNPHFKNLAENTALLIIVISNPDGAAKYQRRTSVNIDMNRDWEKKKSPEVKAISRVISNWKPHLVVDVHQWLPARHMPPPMAEASGGMVAKKAAQAMAYGNKQRGFYLSARSRWGNSTLCHRYFGQRAGVPAILLESRHQPHVPGAREVAIQQEVVALWSATASLGKQ